MAPAPAIPTGAHSLTLGSTMLALAIAAPAAHARTVTLTGTMTGAQEPPPVRVTQATGSTTLVYNQLAGTASVMISVGSLTGEMVAIGPGLTSALIHFAPPGENGPIVLPLVGAPIGVTAFSLTQTYTFAQLLGFGVSGANVALLQTTVGGLVAAPPGTLANLYSNMHTGTYPDGEIRADLVVAGSVVPEPSTYVLPECCSAPACSAWPSPADGSGSRLSAPA